MAKKAIKEQPFEPGYIFSIKLNDDRYAFGRCIAKVSIEHVVEIFNYVSNEPIFDTSITEERLAALFPIDSYSTIRTGKRGEWNVIGKTENFIPKNIDDVRYTFGADPN